MPLSLDAPALPALQVRICQHTSCRRAGGDRVLAAFQQADVPGWDIVASSCLGQCGNGPMVLVLPEEIWYCRVHPDEVAAVVERHLRQGKAIAAMLYRKFHPLGEQNGDE